MLTIRSIDATLYDDLKDLALELIKSSSSIPIGSAAYAFVKIHSEAELLNQNLSALHPVFRHLVRHLADCEEWSQLVVLDLLSRYSRVFLPQPSNDVSIDKDLEAFLSACQYLQSSSNPAVGGALSICLILTARRWQQQLQSLSWLLDQLLCALGLSSACCVLGKARPRWLSMSC